MTYRELDELAWQAAGALIAAGIRAEERLLLCMSDTPELAALFLGGLYIGAVPVPVSTMATARDLATLASDSKATFLAGCTEFAAAAIDAAGCPSIRFSCARTLRSLRPGCSSASRRSTWGKSRNQPDVSLSPSGRGSGSGALLGRHFQAAGVLQPLPHGHPPYAVGLEVSG